MGQRGAVRYCRHVTLMSAMVLASCTGLAAQTSRPAQTSAGEAKPDTAALREERDVEVKTPAPYTSKAWGARLDTEPPGYVKTLDKSGIPGLESLDWLEFGLEHRTRFEYRSDSRRPDLADDEQFLLRSRVYVGVRKILDPFRFGIEFQDARQFHSNFPERSRDVDEADFLQAFGELYFEDALGQGYPVQFRAGRMTLEYIDRRLIGRNRWRNTTNSFDGFRLRLGQPAADWQFDVFAVQPVERRMTSPDRPDEERWFYGLVGAWRGWSKHVTLEPYYFILDEDRKDREGADREIHTVGLHMFGPIGDTRLDYDLDTAFQFGEDGEREQRAFGVYGEVGYTFDHAWKPRLSFSTLYATGDRGPDDGVSERFDRLFEATHPYSTTDLFAWQNTISPKLRLSLRPTPKLRLDTSYGAYWLASDADAWINTGRRDPRGDSDDFVGQELELRVRYRIDPRVELEAGYSHFFPGPFVGNTGPGDDGDLFYVQTTIGF
ncbi:MAG: alginate export family protein [Phycisphaerales bacterium]|nr:MAG: alginate export family protein [Phycisphaerales bacterium]